MVDSHDAVLRPAPRAQRGLISIWRSVLRHPASFFESIQAEVLVGPPIKFAYLMASATWFVVTVSAVAGLTPVPDDKLARLLVFTTVRLVEFPVLAGFGGGLAIWGIGLVLGNGRASYLQSVGVACYATAIFPVSSLVGLLGGMVAPSLNLGQIVWLYGFYIVAWGCITLHRSRPWPTFVVLAVCGLLAMAFFTFLARPRTEPPARASSAEPADRSPHGASAAPGVVPPTTP